MLTTYAKVAPMGWTVVVELPQTEADEPLWRALWIAAGRLLLAAGPAVVLARRVARPIGALTVSAWRLGSADLSHRIDVRSGDEIEELGRQFSAMAGWIGTACAQLEAKVKARTSELALAKRGQRGQRGRWSQVTLPVGRQS